MSTFGGTVKLTGETEYRKALANINASLKASSSEIKMLESAYTSEDSAMLKNANISKTLNQSIQQQAQKVELIKSRLTQASAAYGENDSRTLKLKDAYFKAQTELNKMNTELNKSESEMKQEATATDKAAVSLNKMKGNTLGLSSPLTQMKGALKGLAMSAVAAFSVSGVIAFGKASVEAYKNAQQQATKLTVVMQQRMKASQSEVKSVQDYMAAQSKSGVVGKTAQTQGAQQVSTFLHQTSSLKTLIPAMNNLAVQQHGVNVSGEQMQNIGNLMGKVMQGQTGALKRVGISFTAAQEKVLKYGNEQQKAAMLSKVITDNVGNMNKKMAETPAGKIANARNQMAGLKVTLGAVLLPLVAKLMSVASKIVNFVNTAIPVVKSNLSTVAVVLAGVTAATIAFNSATILSSVARLRAAAAQFSLNAAMAANPVGAVIIGITALVAAIMLLWNHSKKFRTIVTGVFSSVKSGFNSVCSTMVSGINRIKSAFKSFGSFFKSLWHGILAVAKTIAARIIAVFVKIPLKMFSIGKDIVRGLWKGMSSLLDWIVDKVLGLGKAVIKIIRKVFRSNSPSKETEDIGGDLDEGLGLGIERKTKLAVNKAAKMSANVTNSIKTNMNAGSINAQLSTPNTTITPTQSIISTISDTLSRMQSNNQLSASTGNITINLNASLYPNAPTAGKEIVKLYDTYKRRLG